MKYHSRATLCPKCGIKTSRAHCNSRQCNWHMCITCEIAWDKRTGKFIPWINPDKKKEVK